VPSIDVSAIGYDLAEAQIVTPALERRALSRPSRRPSQELIKSELHVRQSTGKPKEHAIAPKSGQGC
jgi:hypothetical protein